jgi:hypothetical protein
MHFDRLWWVSRVLVFLPFTNRGKPFFDTVHEGSNIADFAQFLPSISADTLYHGNPTPSFDNIACILDWVWLNVIGWFCFKLVFIDLMVSMGWEKKSGKAGGKKTRFSSRLTLGLLLCGLVCKIRAFNAHCLGGTIDVLK